MSRLAGACVLLCAALLAPARGDVKEVAERIARARDGAEPAWFEELARHGDARSLRELEKAVEKLQRDELRAAAYQAFRLYAGDPELREQAVEWLRREAGRGKNGARKQAAVRALCGFGDEIAEVLESVLLRNPDAGCRTIACDALTPFLIARGDAESVALVLEHASLERAPIVYVAAPQAHRAALAERPHDEVVGELFAGLDSPELRAALIAKLARSEVARDWKLLLVALLRPRLGVEVSEGLAQALRDPDAAVANAALEALQARDDWDDYEDELRALFACSDPSLRRAAVLALGRLSIGRVEWQAEVLELSRAQDACVRMGAVACLAELRTAPELARLHELLADPDWAVRVEVLESLGRMRSPESVPILIRRLDEERGRLRWDVYAVLRALTGLDLGTQAERWQRWWETEGASFVLPSADAAAQAERERVERGQANRTVAKTFYGLDVVSERVQFVIDVSGSMALPPGVFDPAADVPPGTKRRIDIAKAELVATLRALEDERLFNVIFFDTEVRPFSGNLERMRKKTRAEVLRFVDEQIALGATAMYPALELAFKDPLVDTLFVLTDGAPTHGAITDIREIRAEVARWNAARKVRVHGVAMGIDSDLLRWLAEDTGGTYTRVD